jgi:hypothetical protein
MQMGNKYVLIPAFFTHYYWQTSFWIQFSDVLSKCFNHFFHMFYCCINRRTMSYFQFLCNILISLKTLHSVTFKCSLNACSSSSLILFVHSLTPRIQISIRHTYCHITTRCLILVRFSSLIALFITKNVSIASLMAVLRVDACYFYKQRRMTR